MMTEADRHVLRELAKRVADAARLPEEKKKEWMWLRHNRLERVKPMVLIFPEGSWVELIPEKELLAADPFCRGYEMELRRRLYYREHMQDDNVIDGTVVSPVAFKDTGWGVSEEATQPDECRGAKHFNPVIETEADLDKLRRPEVTVDREVTEENYQKLCGLVGDILPVRKEGRTHFWFAVVDQFARWRGLERIYTDMVDRPEWLHRALGFITECMLEQLDSCEKENALSLNNGAHYCGSGGTGFTTELPQPDFDGTHVRPMDMWGFATTQMFSEVSPAMHEEFALRYEKRWLGRFGLNAYGCCEPLHKKLHLVKSIPRIRRISMSPWVDIGEAAEQLGDKYILSWKPNPAIVAGGQWEPDSVRRIIRDALEKTRGCIVEMILKDTHTCRNQPRRMWDWVRIAKETAGEFAG